jgi:cation diffusion facilitator family transporter
MNREELSEGLPFGASDAGDNGRYREGRKVTWVSIAVNVVLTAMQVLVGLWAHSQALVADAMHTLSDVFADFFVLYANRKGAEAADAEHPYGHARYETAASLVLGLLLMATGAGILISAVERLQNLDSAPKIGVAAVWAAVFTLVGKETLFRYMLAVGERLRSPMLIANAWHARADALSSLVVAVGVGGALLGFAFADAVAAIVVGAMIVKTGAEFAWTAMRELIDTGVDAEEVERIRNTIRATPGVIGLHELRTRRMAQKVLVDAHIQVDAYISVSEGHWIGEEVRRRVLAAHEDVIDLLVHVDPEEDFHLPVAGAPATRLPAREALIRHLRTILGDDGTLKFDEVRLHYLRQRVEAEVFLSPDAVLDSAQVVGMRQRLAAQLPDDPYFRKIALICTIAPN